MIVATLLFVALFIERGHCQTYLGAASERSADLGDVISDALSDAVEDAVETSALNSDTMINLVPPTLTSIPGSAPYRSTNKGISSNSQGGNYVPQSAQQTSSGGKYADNDGTHLGYNKNFENNYTPADILPRTESNSAINYGGSHARNSGTRATDANSNGGNYAPAATTPWIQAEYIAGNGGNYGSSGRAQSSYNSNHGDIHAQTSPPLHTSTNYASNYGNGYGSISGSPTPYYSSNNNKPNTPTSTRGQLFSSFTNTAGGVFINANNAVGSNNIGCAIVNGQLYINGVWRGTVTPAQQALLNQYEEQVAQWGTNLGHNIQEQVESSLYSAFRSGETYPYASQSDSSHDFPKLPDFCNVA